MWNETRFLYIHWIKSISIALNLKDLEKIFCLFGIPIFGFLCLTVKVYWGLADAINSRFFLSPCPFNSQLIWQLSVCISFLKFIQNVINLLFLAFYEVTLKWCWGTLTFTSAVGLGGFDSTPASWLFKEALFPLLNPFQDFFERQMQSWNQTVVVLWSSFTKLTRATALLTSCNK